MPQGGQVGPEDLARPARQHVAGQCVDACGQAVGPDRDGSAGRVAQEQGQGIGSGGQVLLGPHHKRTAAHEVLVVLGQEDLRTRAQLHQPDDRAAPVLRQVEQLTKRAQPQPGGHPGLVRVDRAPLHTDRHCLRLEPGDLDIGEGQRAAGPALVGQPVAEEREQPSDGHLAELVREGGILAEREVASRHAVTAEDRAAVGRKRLGCARVDDRAVTRAKHATARVHVEHRIERTFGRQRAAFRLAHAGERLDDLRLRPCRALQHLLERERRRRGGGPAQRQREQDEEQARQPHLLAFSSAFGWLELPSDAAGPNSSGKSLSCRQSS